MKHDRFNHRGTYKCHLCERQTRDTGTGVDEMCGLCFEICGYDNTINDNGNDPMEYRAECDALLRKIEKRGGNIEKVAGLNSFIWPRGLKDYTATPAKATKKKGKTRRVRLTEGQRCMLVTLMHKLSEKSKDADELRLLITSAKIIAVRV